MSAADELDELEDAHAALVTAQMLTTLLECPEHTRLEAEAKKQHRPLRQRFAAQHGGARGEQEVYQRLVHLETFHVTLVRAELIAQMSHTEATAKEEDAAFDRYRDQRAAFLRTLAEPMRHARAS